MSPQTFNAIFDIFAALVVLSAIGIGGIFVMSIVTSYRHK